MVSAENELFKRFSNKFKCLLFSINAAQKMTYCGSKVFIQRPTRIDGFKFIDLGNASVISKIWKMWLINAFVQLISYFSAEKLVEVRCISQNDLAYLFVVPPIFFDFGFQYG
jgi:hypothetical protein